MIRTRIAPSPTGHFHIGNARTALFNYLLAKKQGGVFVLRIEDTDLERSDPKFEQEIFESLHWLGIRADESPARGGPFGPYRDSERGESHRRALEQLLAEGKAYHCPHSEEELEAEKKTLMATGKNPVHACQYRNSEAGKGIIRFKTPPATKLNFVDLIRGKIEFESDLLGDFSIARNLSSPLYNFAVTVDDAEMEISHIIRGEDHISNTPKQMLLWEALWPDAPMPQYAHLPLILGPDRSKLSSRHGATSIHEFREQGYLPEALVNFLALLGWNPGSDRELFTLDELVAEFDLTKVQKSGAIFNIEKLHWMNGGYIRRKPRKELVPIAMHYLPGFSESDTDGALILEQSRIQKLGDLYEHVSYLGVKPNYPQELLRWKQMTDGEIRASLERSRELLTEIPKDNFTREALEAKFLEAIGAGDKGVLLWPLRVALSGKRASPSPFEIMAVLGRGESLQRIDTAIEKVGKS